MQSKYTFANSSVWIRLEHNKGQSLLNVFDLWGWMSGFLTEPFYERLFKSAGIPAKLFFLFFIQSITQQRESKHEETQSKRAEDWGGGRPRPSGAGMGHSEDISPRFTSSLHSIFAVLVIICLYPPSHLSSYTVPHIFTSPLHAFTARATVSASLVRCPTYLNAWVTGRMQSPLRHQRIAFFSAVLKVEA